MIYHCHIHSPSKSSEPFTVIATPLVDERLLTWWCEWSCRRTWSQFPISEACLAWLVGRPCDWWSKPSLEAVRSVYQVQTLCLWCNDSGKPSYGWSSLPQYSETLLRFWMLWKVLCISEINHFVIGYILLFSLLCGLVGPHSWGETAPYNRAIALSNIP